MEKDDIQQQKFRQQKGNFGCLLQRENLRLALLGPSFIDVKSVASTATVPDMARWPEEDSILTLATLHLFRHKRLGRAHCALTTHLCIRGVYQISALPALEAQPNH
jgi:hypothetical protein